MLRDAPQSAVVGDRERRARLEQLQAELKAARAEAAAARESSAAAVKALEEAVSEAKARLEQAKQRKLDVQRRLEAVRHRIQALKERQKEARILALGASRRDKYIDWAPQDSGRGMNPGFQLMLATIWFLFALVAVLAKGCPP
ncbi:MAG: hypothetical protein AB1938_02915 [Myxococcota bacterium]